MRSESSLKLFLSFGSKGGRSLLTSPPCLESQGCHLILSAPLFCLVLLLSLLVSALLLSVTLNNKPEALVLCVSDSSKQSSTRRAELMLVVWWGNNCVFSVFPFLPPFKKKESHSSAAPLKWKWRQTFHYQPFPFPSNFLLPGRCRVGFPLKLWACGELLGRLGSGRLWEHWLTGCCPHCSVGWLGGGQRTGRRRRCSHVVFCSF